MNHRLKSPVKPLRCQAPVALALSVVLLVVGINAQDGLSAGEKQFKADGILSQASLLWQRGDWILLMPMADRLVEARAIYRELGVRRPESICLFLLGHIYQRKGDTTKATEAFERSLPLLRETPDVSGEANTLMALGPLYGAAGQTEKALETHRRSIDLFKSLGDALSQARATTGLCMTLYFIGEPRKALECHKSALPLYIDARNRAGQSAALISGLSGEALTWHNIGGIQFETGETAKALSSLTRALSVYSKIDDKRGQITAISLLGQVHASLGDKARALEILENGLRLAEELLKTGDGSGMMSINEALGWVHGTFGDKDRAESYFTFVELEAKIQNQPLAAARALSLSGEISLALGDFNDARKKIEQALAINRSQGDSKGEAFQQLKLSSVYSALGEVGVARDYALRALELFKKRGMVVSEAEALRAVGNTYRSSGDLWKAFGAFLEARAIMKRAENVAGEAFALVDLSSIYLLFDQRAKSVESLNSALELFRKIGKLDGEAHCLNALADVHLREGNFRKALETSERSLSFSLWFQDRRGMVQSLGNLMSVWNRLGNPRLAVFYGKAAVDVLQDSRRNTVSFDRELQRSFVRSVQTTYRNLAESLIKQDRLCEAIEVINALRDQQAFDSVGSGTFAPKGLTPTPREKSAQENLGKVGEVAALAYGELRRLQTVTETAETVRLKAIADSFPGDFGKFFRTTESAFSGKPGSDDAIQSTAGARELQGSLERLSTQTGRNAVAVYQLSGAEAFHSIVVSPDGIDRFSSPISDLDVNVQAFRLWRLLQAPDYDTTVVSGKLYDTVFRPLESKIPEGAVVMWAPDANLRYIPAAALYDRQKKRFLAERNAHTVFTRADAERMTRSVSPRWTGTGFGATEAATVDVAGSKVSFGELPGVKAELASVFGGIVGGDTFADAKFNRVAFLGAMKQKRPLVHIASHFSFRPGDEARSFLLLGDKTAFTLEEIKKEEKLFEGVELLTLSACSTAAQLSGANGREIDGFAELAQRLGAGAVMATLWPVSDASTPWLMREFYRARESGEGMTKAAALRQAQLALLNGTARAEPLPGDTRSASAVKDGLRSPGNTRGDVIYLDGTDAPAFTKDPTKPFAHPFYWSPFVLFGNWK